MSPTLRWQKSSFSGGDEDTNCLEIAADTSTLHLRESDTPSAVLILAPTALRALLGALERRTP